MKMDHERSSWCFGGLFLSMFVLLNLAACSGGGGGSDGGDSTTLASGYFIDDPVQGLEYQSGNQPAGVTDASGMYIYEVGASVTFYVDGVEIGELASGMDVVTPFDFGAQNGRNIASFLQSLDQSSGAGIDLTGVDIPSTPIDFTQGDAAFQNDAGVIAALAAVSASFVPQDDAIAAVPDTSVTPYADADIRDSWAFARPSENADEIVLMRYFDDDTGRRFFYDASDVLTVAAFDWSVNQAGEIVHDFTQGGFVATETKIAETEDDDGIGGDDRHIVYSNVHCPGCPSATSDDFLSVKRLPLSIEVADFENKTFNITDEDANTHVLAFGAHDQNGTFGPFGTGTLTPAGESAVDIVYALGSSGILVVGQDSGNPGQTGMFRDVLFLIDGDVSNGIYVHYRYLVDDANGASGNGVADPGDPIVGVDVIQELIVEEQ